jgi:hypothetical protein
MSADECLGDDDSPWNVASVADDRGLMYRKIILRCQSPEQAMDVGHLIDLVPLDLTPVETGLSP